MGKLDGKVAVVTGGSSGIGFAIAHRFVEEGAEVVITGRRVAELDASAAALGRNASVVQGDIADLDDLDRLWATVKERHGGVDVIVANAGHVEAVTLAASTPEHFDRTFGVNARGTFFTVQKALPLLRDGGSVVLVASSVHRAGISQYTTYSASKAAVRSFARSWAAEVRFRNIRVNVLSPGLVDTPIIDLQAPSPEKAAEMRTRYGKTVPLRRLGKVEEMAAAALFLACDDSSYCTGIDLLADGGQIEL